MIIMHLTFCFQYPEATPYRPAPAAPAPYKPAY